MRARSDVCSEMRLAMMPPVLTNGLSLLCDSRQRWKKPMRSLAASLPGELHAASTPSLAGWAGLVLRARCVPVLVHSTAPAQLLSTWELSPWCRRHQPCSPCWGLDSCVGLSCSSAAVQAGCRLKRACVCSARCSTTVIHEVLCCWEMLQGTGGPAKASPGCAPLGWGTAWGQLSLPFSYCETFRGFRSLFPELQEAPWRL